MQEKISILGEQIAVVLEKERLLSKYINILQHDIICKSLHSDLKNMNKKLRIFVRNNCVKDSSQALQDEVCHGNIVDLNNDNIELEEFILLHIDSSHICLLNKEEFLNNLFGLCDLYWLPLNKMLSKCNDLLSE